MDNLKNGERLFIVTKQIRASLSLSVGKVNFIIREGKIIRLQEMKDGLICGWAYDNLKSKQPFRYFRLNPLVIENNCEEIFLKNDKSA